MKFQVGQRVRFSQYSLDKTDESWDIHALEFIRENKDKGVIIKNIEESGKIWLHDNSFVWFEDELEPFVPTEHFEEDLFNV